ncbi:hypothetical protein A2917_03265 [Candidatus Nomurabacteria bacterium RIFCSPLOWO2_01_FULL_42_17]|uniref:Uncharacterized protein n=1 Tax=Candidatus Nomurabacteria bacterium RIFCSPLOWO2_01_FULL_42_17 TaxID=1801780 RepID=A0A1F6XN42_9BACT|nr:MAG: hypothetical protein A2917_03265 [Candidatus Nomurabacteria bacterium RIFCSPLOWO2_01_FULL_42_17]
MEKTNETQNKIVQTYAEDMAKVIEDDKSGLIKKIIHEEEEHEIEKKNLSPESKKNKFFMAVGVSFILLGFLTLFYFIFGQGITTVPVEKQFLPIIFTDKSAFVEMKGLKKEKIAQTILSQVKNTKVKSGGVEGIYLTENKEILGLHRFLTVIESNFANLTNLTSSANPLFFNDNFLMGVVNTETDETGAGKDFFILLKVRSMPDIFEPMRAWEDKMFFDLHGFFGANITPETKYLLTQDFEDGVVQNKNARVLYQKNQGEDEEGVRETKEIREIMIMYIFADDNSVIITNTEHAAGEIMLRLTASRVKK